MKTPINPLNKTITVQGTVFWSDGRRRIDLKRPIRDFFEPMESTQTLYVMELCLSKEKVHNRIENLAEKNVIPILLYFVKEVPSLQNSESEVEK